MAMRPAYPKPFNYIKATSIEEALKAVEGGAQPLAGGQSLSTLLKLRLVETDTLVDIFELDELRYVRREGDVLRVGALLVHNDVAMNKIIVEWAPALADAAWYIADLQVRNRGTIGGSVAHADPAANYLPALMALGATAVTRSTSGEREIPLEDLIEGPYQTSLRNELIVEFKIPRWDKQAVVVVKRGGASYPSLVLAIALRIQDGVVAESRVAVGALYTRPAVVKNVLNGVALGELKAAAEKLAKEIPQGEPYGDFHIPFEKKQKILPLYLKQLVKKLDAAWALPVREEITRWRGQGDKILVNGREVEVEHEPRLLLLDYLRRAGATEVKRGCDEGKCGACTVLMDGRAVKSCTIFAPQARGHAVATVKGVADAYLRHVQKAFVEEYASQCGYCTHGFVMATYGYLTQIDPEAKTETMRLSLKNICRCTGYINIIKAIRKASRHIKSL